MKLRACLLLAIFVLATLFLFQPSVKAHGGSRVRHWIVYDDAGCAQIYVYTHPSWTWPEMYINAEGPMQPSDIQPKYVCPIQRGVHSVHYTLKSTFSDGYVETHDLDYLYGHPSESPPPDFSASPPPFEMPWGCAGFGKCPTVTPPQAPSQTVYELDVVAFTDSVGYRRFQQCKTGTIFSFLQSRFSTTFTPGRYYHVKGSGPNQYPNTLWEISEHWEIPSCPGAVTLPSAPAGETWISETEFFDLRNQLLSGIHEYDQALSFNTCVTDALKQEAASTVVEHVVDETVKKGFGKRASIIVNFATRFLFGTRDDLVRARNLYKDRLEIMDWRWQLKHVNGDYAFRYRGFVRVPFHYRDLPVISFGPPRPELSDVVPFLDVFQCWLSPGPGPSPTEPLLSFPPGIYVTGLEPQPGSPKRNAGVPFVITFVNTTPGPQNFELLVQIFYTDTRKGFGETVVKGITVPVGVTQITSPDNWAVRGPGGCISLFARALFIATDNSRTPFLAPDGSTPEVYFTVC